MSSYLGDSAALPPAHRSFYVAIQNSVCDRSPLSIASMPAIEIPLTILTGWLGAGKTTLMHHVVATLSAANKKVAWIQNEFAAGGVEDSVVLSGDEVFTDIVELANGCVCCTVKSDFVAGLEALVKQKRFDCIFLECSGLADPGALAGMFWQVA
jgi:G3E family GTPase